MPCDWRLSLSLKSTSTALRRALRTFLLPQQRRLRAHLGDREGHAEGAKGRGRAGRGCSPIHAHVCRRAGTTQAALTQQEQPLPVTYRQALCKLSWLTGTISGRQLSMVPPNLGGKKRGLFFRRRWVQPMPQFGAPQALGGQILMIPLKR